MQERGASGRQGSLGRPIPTELEKLPECQWAAHLWERREAPVGVQRGSIDLPSRACVQSGCCDVAAPVIHRHLVGPRAMLTVGVPIPSLPLTLTGIPPPPPTEGAPYLAGGEVCNQEHRGPAGAGRASRGSPVVWA